jgi:hypothetical protein
MAAAATSRAIRAFGGQVLVGDVLVGGVLAGDNLNGDPSCGDVPCSDLPWGKLSCGDARSREGGPANIAAGPAFPDAVCPAGRLRGSEAETRAAATPRRR